MYTYLKGGVHHMGGTISSNNTRTNITFPTELTHQLEELAKEQNRSFNNLVITILKTYVDNKSAK